MILSEDASTAASSSSTELTNPISESNPTIIIANVIRAMLGVLGAVTLLMFIYGGFMLVFSQGNEEKLKKGRGTLIWAIIGMAIVLTSYSILSYVFKIIAGSTGA
ncbi:MAG: hypothetical protein WC752_00585 [Patescibacteria group bacterium]